VPVRMECWSLSDIVAPIEGQHPDVERRQVSEEETELAARAHAGDLDAFGQLVDQYAPQARRVARAVLGNVDDGDDAAQDGFLSALKNLGRYDPSRPFGPWLMRIVANAAVDRRRRKKVRAVEALSPTLPSSGPGPASETDRRAMMDTLDGALKQLPERQRLAVTLFDVEGYAHAEIAEMMNVPQGTVRSDVFHARRALRSALKPWQEWKEEIS